MWGHLKKKDSDWLVQISLRMCGGVCLLRSRETTLWAGGGGGAVLGGEVVEALLSVTM